MAHVFDLASNWPADTVIMIAQGWYAIPGDDGGSDEDYGVWNPGDPQAWHAADPVTYPEMPYNLQDASVCNGGERFIGSQLRPLTGLYSDTGKDDKSIAKIDRDLGMLRRAGAPRARVDVLACTLGLIQFTSFNGLEEGDADYTRGLDNRYRYLDKCLERANAASLTSCIAVNYEAYYIWQFFSDVYTTKIARLGAVALDLEDLVNKMKADPAAFKVGGRLVIFWYRGTLGETITNAEWNATMEAVRTATGHDFFVVGRDFSGDSLGWLDGAFPWIRYQTYIDAAGATVEAKAENWVQDAMTNIAANVADTGNYPGRIAIANFTPGLWDWVLEWGAGNTDRYIPRGTALIDGQFTGYGQLAARPHGICCVTWNGYPEGHCIEPTTADNAETVAYMSEKLASWLSESADADELAALKAIWQDAPKDITCPIQQTQPGPHVRKARRISPRGPA